MARALLIWYFVVVLWLFSEAASLNYLGNTQVSTFKKTIIKPNGICYSSIDKQLYVVSDKTISVLSLTGTLKLTINLKNSKLCSLNDVY